jgi:ATP-dependent Clp protease protease subunit
MKNFKLDMPPDTLEEDKEVDLPGLFEKLKNSGIGMASPAPLFLIGDISEQNLGFIMVQLEQAQQTWLDSGEADFKNLNIKMTSTGGSIGIGFALHDLIKNSSLNITIEGYGYVCSAAVLPLMAGKNRGLSKYTRLMLHEAYVNMDDMSLTKKGLASHRKELNILFNNYCKILANRSGQPMSKIKELCEHETYLSAREALELNLIDYIV